MHSKHRDSISNVEKVVEATGLGGVVGNKGGCVVKFELYGTSLCFVSCHLAAHEGKKFLNRRNADVVEILYNARIGGRSLDVASQFHHCFWMGDLNYRTDLAIVDGNEDRPHEEHFAQVQAMVEKGEFAKLYAADQLQDEMKKQEVLVGWQEARINFPPTFKLTKGQVELKYNPKRVPSYTDRILWKSLPLRDKDLRCTGFSSIPEITSSDHKPVRATFEWQRPPQLLRQLVCDDPRDDSHGDFEVCFEGCQCKDLVAKDLKANGERTSDPYIRFFGDPVTLLQNNVKCRSTPYKAGTLEPQWSGEEMPALLIRMRAGENGLGAKSLSDASAHLIAVIYDHDLMNMDDLMGQLALPVHANVQCK